MKRLLFTDLDDTLFQSHRKRPPEPGFLPLAYLENGEPISYASPLQQGLLAVFEEAGFEIIPVTARNRAGFCRVDYPFRAGAVLSYGGVILGPDGALDEVWHRSMVAHVQATAPALAALFAQLSEENTRAGLGLTLRPVTDCGLTFYIVAKSPDGEIQGLTHLRTHFQTALEAFHPCFHWHHNANNLALMPRWLDKSKAVAHLLARYRACETSVMVWGMGDSLIDLGFMHLCDYQIIPAGTQIAHHLERTR